MVKGKIKFFKDESGFGFITADPDEDGTEKDYFFHKTDLNGARVTKDDRVEFDIVQGDRGPKAANVKKEE